MGRPGERPLTTRMQWKAPVPMPESIQAHIEQAISHIKGLSPTQKNSVRAAMLAMTRDLHFVKLIMDQMPSAPASQDEGRIL
jgi:hypothetical protein